MAVDENARQAPATIATGGYDRDDGRGRQDLQPAQSEHEPPHGHQALVRQLEPDQKEEKHDAQIGDDRDVLGIDDCEPVEQRDLLDERTEAQRAEDDAGAQVAEDGTETPATHHRHDDAGRAENDQGVAVGCNVDRRCHAVSVVRKL
jgi:hypothetical protein